MTEPRTPDPTALDADYYPRIKLRRRWYLIVPEMVGLGDSSYHEGCAFFRPELERDDSAFSMCALMTDAKRRQGEEYVTPEFERHDCGDNSTIFVAPSKFPAYRAHLVANKLEGKT